MRTVITDITHTEDEVGGELVFNFQIPVLHHARPSIAWRKVGNSAKPSATAPVVLRRIQVGWLRIAWYSRIEEQCGTKRSIKAGRGCVAIGQGLTEISISKGCVINAVASTENRIVKLPEERFRRLRKADPRSKISVLGLSS